MSDVTGLLDEVMDLRFKYSDARARLNEAVATIAAQAVEIASLQEALASLAPDTIGEQDIHELAYQIGNQKGHGEYVDDSDYAQAVIEAIRREEIAALRGDGQGYVSQ